MRGEDRQRFVNGYVTADVKTIEVGSGVYAFVPTPQGKIRSEVVILALETACGSTCREDWELTSPRTWRST